MIAPHDRAIGHSLCGNCALTQERSDPDGASGLRVTKRHLATTRSAQEDARHPGQDDPGPMTICLAQDVAASMVVDDSSPTDAVHDRGLYVR